MMKGLSGRSPGSGPSSVSGQTKRHEGAMIEWWEALIGLITVLGGRELLAKMMDRKASAAATKQVNTATKADEVEILRDVLSEVRADSAEKTVRLTALEVRMTKLEERERHNLTRAAVHEAWDQMAFQFLLQHNPDHPPPPPIMVKPAELQDQELF